MLQFGKALTDYKVNDILAFKSVKVNDYNGKQLNSTGDTTIIKNPDDPRTKVLRDWKNGGGTSELVSLTTKANFTGVVAMIAEIIKTGETLPVDPKGMMCWVSGNIIGLQYEKGFYYMGCKKCKKKVLDTQCDKCKEEVVPYYMFNMKISDGTASIWIHVFGDQGEGILGKPASEVLQLQEVDNGEFRQIFEKAKGNVRIKNNYRHIQC